MLNIINLEELLKFKRADSNRRFKSALKHPAPLPPTPPHLFSCLIFKPIGTRDFVLTPYHQSSRPNLKSHNKVNIMQISHICSHFIKINYVCV